MLKTRSLPLQRYRPASIALHWGMVVVLVTVYITIELAGLLPKGSDPRQAMKAVHASLGLSVLALVLLLLGTVGAVLVGYVVTNYGTLFRLRLLAVVPFWLLPLVAAPRPGRSLETS